GLGLADAGRAQEDERADRPVRVLETGTRAAHCGRHRGERVVLADHAHAQLVLHVEQLRLLALEHLRDRDAGPLRDDLGDLLGGDLFAEQRALALDLGELLALGGDLLLDLDELAVADLGVALELRLALRALELGVESFAALLQLAHARDRALLVLPAALHRVALLAQLRDLARDRRESGFARGVAFLLQRLALDLELDAPSLELVELLGARGDRDAPGARRLCDEVDRLVGQEAIGDVAVRERRGRDERGVLDPHAVVDLAALLEPAQDRDRVLDRRLADEHGLETALERSVLLDVLAVLVERGGADAAQLAARERGLEH